MTTDETTRDLAAVGAMDTPALRAELARALTLTAHGLAYLAAVWAELTRRGEDLSHLRSGLARYLPAIAAGTLAAETVVAFAGQRAILNRLATRPIEEQRHLAAGELVPVLLPADDGELVERALPLQALSQRQAATVLDDHGRVRSPIEQRQLLSRQPRQERQRRGISPAELRGALAALSVEELQRLAEARGLTVARRCTHDGCKRPVHIRDLCASHYQSRPRQKGDHQPAP